MNKKYVVGHEEQCLMICQTRTDAEEMLLSIAEESVYENWFYDNFFGRVKEYVTPAEFINKNNDENEISDWGWVLYSFSYGYWIDEVVYLD
jgi:hypothetical protein